MKNLFLISFLFLSFSAFSQQGVEVKGNRLITREIPPVWPGCEGTEAEKKVCFREKLTQHLKENYKFPRDANGKMIRGKAVISFHINEQGKVEILGTEGSSKELNAEAERIILAIPQMTPGQLSGKPIAVKYKVPFTF